MPFFNFFILLHLGTKNNLIRFVHFVFA